MSFTFRYVRTLRDQILECRSDCMLEVPVIIVGNKYDLPESSHIGKREIANIIKKQWKCAYVECSAKCNWHVISLFKEVMKAVDLIDYTQHRITAERNRQNAQRGCVILWYLHFLYYFADMHGNMHGIVWITNGYLISSLLRNLWKRMLVV